MDHRLTQIFRTRFSALVLLRDLPRGKFYWATNVSDVEKNAEPPPLEEEFPEPPPIERV